jgi:hypothetical protein
MTEKHCKAKTLEITLCYINSIKEQWMFKATFITDSRTMT